MVIDMNFSKLKTIEQIQEFLDGTAKVVFFNPARIHTWIDSVYSNSRFVAIADDDGFLKLSRWQRPLPQY